MCYQLNKKFQTEKLNFKSLWNTFQYINNNLKKQRNLNESSRGEQTERKNIKGSASPDIEECLKKWDPSVQRSQYSPQWKFAEKEIRKFCRKIRILKL